MNKRLIKYYKGVVLALIHSKLVLDDFEISVDQVDLILKTRAGLVGSTKDMANWEIHGLILESITFGEKIGIKIQLPSEREQVSEFPYWD